MRKQEHAPPQIDENLFDGSGLSPLVQRNELGCIDVACIGHEWQVYFADELDCRWLSRVVVSALDRERVDSILVR